MKPIVITGNNISIRTFVITDITNFHTAAIESVEHMHQYMPWCHPGYSINESELWVTSRSEAWDSAEEYSFLVISNTSNDLLGGVAINQINESHKIGNIGYWIKKQALNKGVTTEAVKLLVNFGFKSLGLNRLEIITLPDNIASNAEARKLGAKYEGVMQHRLFVHDVSRDACQYSLINDQTFFQ